MKIIKSIDSEVMNYALLAMDSEMVNILVSDIPPFTLELDLMIRIIGI
jgi:hypothetical protein